MQALIKKGTESNPVWGFIRYGKFWDLIETEDKPTIFKDQIDFDMIDNLTNGQASKLGFKLVTITISVQ